MSSLEIFRRICQTLVRIMKVFLINVWYNFEVGLFRRIEAKFLIHIKPIEGFKTQTCTYMCHVNKQTNKQTNERINKQKRTHERKNERMISCQQQYQQLKKTPRKIVNITGTQTTCCWSRGQPTGRIITVNTEVYVPQISCVDTDF